MKPAFTRRAFLQSSLAVVSTAATLPLFVEQSAFAIDDAADGKLVKNKSGVPDDRILVIVQLSGGNDGLNTVIPFGKREYYNARPMIAIPQNQILTLDDKNGIGLHPETSSLRERSATINMRFCDSK